MSNPTQNPDPLLRLVHRTVLAALALCAIVIVLQADVVEDAVAPRSFTGVALSLAIVSIGGRRLASTQGRAPGPRRILEVAGLIAAAGIAIAALALVMAGGDRQSGLLFVLGAAILTLRPPAAPPAP